MRGMSWVRFMGMIFILAYSISCAPVSDPGDLQFSTKQAQMNHSNTVPLGVNLVGDSSKAPQAKSEKTEPTQSVQKIQGHQQQYAADRHQCEISGEDYDQAVQFVRKIQQAVQNDNQSAFLALGAYPVRFNQGGHSSMLLREALAKQYDEILTLKLKKAILAQDPQDIFCNFQGAFIAEGGVWFHANQQQYGFFVLNAI